MFYIPLSFPDNYIINNTGDGNLNISYRAIKKEFMPQFELTNDIDCYYQWNINFSDLLNSSDCQNGAGVWTLLSFKNLEDLKIGQPIVTPPLENTLKKYWENNFVPFSGKDQSRVGRLFLSENVAMISLKSRYAAMVQSNIDYVLKDFISPGNLYETYFYLGNPATYDPTDPQINPPYLYRPFILNYIGPTTVSGNTPVDLTFTVNFNFGDGLTPAQRLARGPEYRTGPMDNYPYNECDYSILYATTDKGVVANSSTLSNSTGPWNKTTDNIRGTFDVTFSFDPSNMNVGDVANIRVGAHWFYISQVFQITKIS